MSSSQLELIQRLLFDYQSLTKQEIVENCELLDQKVLRWLGANHPDNRTRKIFFRQTNVSIGKGTVLNPGLVFSYGYLPLVEIRERVAVSPNVMIVAQSAPNNSKLASIPYVREHLIAEAPVT